MKNLIIVLLIAALGAAAYFYFSKKNHHAPAPESMIVGKWRIDSLVTPPTHDSLRQSGHGLVAFDDSSLKHVTVEFATDSLVFEVRDNKVSDTSHYEFSGAGSLSVWGNGDSTRTKFTVEQLDSSSLVLQAADSSRYYFKKF